MAQVTEEQPLVSIVIPVYNGSNFMRCAIDSALAQTYPDIEILVVNDGSTDDTRDIALSYGDKIRYFEKENGGVATALNLAIREMNGRYFSWLSHDDWYEPEKVETEMETLRRSGHMNQAVYSDYDIIEYPSGRRQRARDRRYGETRAETGWFAAIMGLIDGCSLLIPKTYFDEFGGFDESIRAANDYEQFFRMFRDRRVLHIEKTLVHYRQHARQVTWNYADMAAESDWFYAWAIPQLVRMEPTAGGVTLYEVFSLLLADMTGAGKRPETVARLKDYLRTANEPAHAAASRARLAEKIRSCPGGCYVYCAGRMAKKFVKNLRWRGLTISGASDTDPAKWGTAIDGLRILPPSDLPKDARIVVANAFPEEIAAQLRAQGFRHVETADTWDGDFLTTPIQKDLCEVLR